MPCAYSAGGSTALPVSSSLPIATTRLGDHPLRVVLGELASAPGVLRLTVPPLSLVAVEDLAGRRAQTP